jgi:2-phosphosulfolactate phosphatase
MGNETWLAVSHVEIVYHRGMKSLYVHLLPDLVDESDLFGQTTVVIDCLRATSTIAYALAAGAREVIPCLEVDEARTRASQFPKSSVLLGGERQGVRIEGFDLGNSPTEYTPGVVAARSIVFTTTNGTRAMQRCREARRVVMGALVNRSAVVEALASERVVHIVCAGTRGRITREDALAAGAIGSWLVERGDWNPDDEARLAIAAWEAVRTGDLVAALHDTQGGRNLVAEGFENDIATCARLDAIDLAPELDVKSWTIPARP